MKFETRNILIVAVSLFLTHASFYASLSCQKTVLDAFKTYKVNAYLGLALSNVSFVISTALYPIFAFQFPVKYILITSASLMAFLAVPLIYPYPPILYTLDFFAGSGLGPLWSSVGRVISKLSSRSTLDRNSGIIFFFYMSGPLSAYFFVFCAFSGKTEISDELRYLTISTLCVVGFLSPVCLLLFREEAPSQVRTENGEKGPLLASATKLENSTSIKSYDSPLAVLKTIPKTARLAVSHPILMLLEPMFLLTGLEMAFWTGVLGTCIGNYVYEKNAKPLLGLCGVFVGAGELIAALVRTVIPRFLRANWILPVTTTFGAITFYLSFFLLYLFLPSPTVQHEVSTPAYVTTWYEFFIVLAGFLFGFSDCILQTQLFASIGVWFPNIRENDSTFSVFYILQAVGGSIMFALSTFYHLTTLLVVLTVATFVSTTGLIMAELKYRKDQKRYLESVNQRAIQ